MKKYLTIFFIILLLTSLNPETASKKKYNIIKPDGTIDPAALQLAIQELSQTTQPQKFNKINTTPEANQIGEQQMMLYRATDGTARLYTIIDNTTYYFTATEVGTKGDYEVVTFNGDTVYISTNIVYFRP